MTDLRRPASPRRTPSTSALRLAGLALAAVLLAGCAASRPPASVTGDTAVPPQFYAPVAHGGSQAGLASWWSRFGDPVLLRVIDAAQTASPTLVSARARIEQARATRVAAQAALLPSLDAAASLQRSYTQPPTPASTVAQVGLQPSWAIDVFGGGRATRDAASLRLAGAEAGWHDARVLVAAEAASGYFSQRNCERLLEVARSDAASRAETARLSDVSTKAGFTAPATDALARASAAEAAQRVTQQQAQCEVDVKALVALTALTEPALRTALAGAPIAFGPEASPPPLPALPAAVLAQRPDLAAADLEVAAAAADVGSARADRYPRLGLSGSIGVGRVRFSGVSTDANTWSVGPLTLSLPIFDGGRRAANVVAAEARYEDAAATYRGRARQAVREVEEALVNLDAAARRDTDARIAAEGYRVSFVATEARYRSGLASLVELEDARRLQLASQTALVNLERERVAAWVALYRAAGGGWQAGDAVPIAAAR